MSAVIRRSFFYTGGRRRGRDRSRRARPLLAPAARAATAARGPARRPAGGGIYVAAGQTYTVAATTRVSAVTIEPGGVLTAPAGHSLTMTVNGVETGQRLVATGGAGHRVRRRAPGAATSC